MSHENARDIYKVAYDEETLVVDVEATAEARAAERLARIARGKPFDAFCDAWVTQEPPATLPYFGSWNDRAEIYATTLGQRVRMPADAIQGAFMLDPKDVRIAELEAQLSDKAAQA